MNKRADETLKKISKLYSLLEDRQSDKFIEDIMQTTPNIKQQLTFEQYNIINSFKF